MFSIINLMLKRIYKNIITQLLILHIKFKSKQIITYDKNIQHIANKFRVGKVLKLRNITQIPVFNTKVILLNLDTETGNYILSEIKSLKEQEKIVKCIRIIKNYTKAKNNLNKSIQIVEMEDSYFFDLYFKE